MYVTRDFLELERIGRGTSMALESSFLHICRRRLGLFDDNVAATLFQIQFFFKFERRRWEG